MNGINKYKDRHGYEDLANAIVIKAANDYRLACRRYKRGDDRAYLAIKQLEKFFKSKWGDLLCNGKADVILEKLREEQGAEIILRMETKPKEQFQCYTCKYFTMCSFSKQAQFKRTGMKCNDYKEKER